MCLASQGLTKLLSLNGKEREKKAKDAANKAIEDAKLKKIRDQEDARRVIMHGKQVSAFNLQWSVAGHPHVPEFATLAEASKAICMSDDSYTTPAVVKGLGIKFDKLDKTFEEWAAQSSKHCEAKNTDRASAPLKAHQGVSELDLVWKELTPPDWQLSDCSPSTKCLLSAVSLMANMPCFMQCDWETQFLGSVKYHHTGHTAYMLMSITGLEPALKTIMKTPDTPTAEAMLKWVAALNPESATVDTLKEWLLGGIKVYHVKVEPGQTLVVPPGYIVVSTTLNDKASLGIRKAFLPKGPSTIKAFEGLVRACRASGSSSVLRATLDALVVADAKAKEKEAKEKDVAAAIAG